MRLKILFFLFVGCAFFLPSLAGAQQVSVDIVSDRGRLFPVHPTGSHDRNTYRAYLEAKEHARYGIRIKNHTDRRVGLVVAVDGRNIISGKKSHLRRSEHMYLLDPYKSLTYKGWRTGPDRINRFYFTTEGGSYAGAWNDYSAMGVIAVAVFPEKVQEMTTSSPTPQPMMLRRNMGRAPGTGFGRAEYSASEPVYDFTPQSHSAEKHLFKYEWRKTLCQKGIISCTRLWDEDDGFAPPPPR
jgi:hypothetical protein